MTKPTKRTQLIELLGAQRNSDIARLTDAELKDVHDLMLCAFAQVLNVMAKRGKPSNVLLRRFEDI